MARRAIKFTEDEIAKRYREGRGSGDVRSYKPWLTTHDLSSLGESVRVPSPKTGRGHHLLSGIETGAFLELILNPNVIDVQEQYPLDREDTRPIALDLGVKHPTYPGGSVDVVMTTDLVVYVKDGDAIRRFARAVKPASELDNAGVLLKLEIEKRFWARRGVDWMIITEHEQTQQRRNGLEWIHARYELDKQPDPTYWTTRIEAFLAACRKGHGKSFEEIERGLMLRRDVGEGEMISIIRHLCAVGRIAYDPERVFDTTWLVSDLPVLSPEVNARAA